MKRWGWLCLLGVLNTTSAFALNVVVSHTLFYNSPSGKSMAPYAEVYWEIDPSSIQYSKNENGAWIAQVRTDILLTNEAGEKVAEDHFILQTLPTTTVAQARQQTISDLRKYPILPGKIKMQIDFSDVATLSNKYVYTDSFAIKKNVEKPFFSGIQLLDTFYKSAQKSPFVKNDMLQLPLSLNYFGERRSSIHFYAELYNAQLALPSNTSVMVTSFISKKPLEGAVYNILHRDTLKTASAIPVLNTLDIRALPSGNYFLNVILEDSNKNILANEAIFFQRNNKNPTSLEKSSTGSDSIQQVNILDLSNTFVAKFNAAQLKAILKMLKPVSSIPELENIKSLLSKPDLMYMQYFVYNFWKNRNSRDPKKAWDEYTEKVRETNKLFGKGGYEKDRGHVYLKYGKPTERIIVENEQGSLPYEIWQYNVTEKGSNGIFLFYRPSHVLGDMLLLHSNVPGEVRNNAWRTQLYLPMTTDHSNAQAEKYLFR